jgi:SAM-dependent methyltransferase
VSNDAQWLDSMPEVYDRVLGPTLFAQFATEVAARAASMSPTRVLELAAGTGIGTAELVRALPTADIVATDLNAAMVVWAAERVPGAAWSVADAQSLDFPDGSFDLVVCQFGVMFFPVRATALAEARRVLAPDGVLLFNVWDRIEENEFADTVISALAGVFPDDPPRFLARTPHGYHDPAAIERDLQSAGFTGAARIDTVPARSRASSPRVPAIAYCQGTPLRSEIEARDASRLGEATDVAAAALERRFGSAAVDARIQALVVTVDR